MTNPTPKVWFITGCSSGIGLALARAVLSHGHLVIASSRNPSKTPSLVDEITQAGGHWLQLDVSSAEANIKATIDEAVSIHGRLDVLVNNAGYVVRGAVEDVSLPTAHQILQTNFLGPLTTIQSALPYMRTARTGTIINVTSIGGLIGLPAVGLYSATKFALEGLSETLSQEVSEFGIRVLLVEPGPFRTNMLGNSGAESVVGMSEGYRGGTVVERTLQSMERTHGMQDGDPEKAAERMWEVVEDLRGC
ncbi:NAD(P)-binding protein [Aspergillus ellipticus CBS 707.79]|uniref:NAD(P)-binding protein n=1 Tax=Aspergillus ellipticus CBS 707.79 TaxID=1448320 RepID=A0A319F357_9EURO|nr:NAD(P)-binding protein [Aspergillus ellipticus CBS 707.79]